MRELLLFQGSVVDPYLLSLLSQNSNSYFSMISYKGIDIPVFSSLHPCAEKNIVAKLRIPYISKSIDSIAEVRQLIDSGSAVLISYDADCLSRGVKTHNFGLISTTVLWDYSESKFTSTRQDDVGFVRYDEHDIFSSMCVDTQPVAPNREVIYLTDAFIEDNICTDSLVEAIKNNLLESKENITFRNSKTLAEYNCIEGANAFSKMRACLKELNHTIVSQSSMDVVRRVFVLSMTIMLKVMEKNGFGFASFENCFWFGYRKFMQLIGKSTDSELCAFAEDITNRWNGISELLSSIKAYSRDVDKINEFFELLELSFSDIERIECLFFSHLSF